MPRHPLFRRALRRTVTTLGAVVGVGVVVSAGGVIAAFAASAGQQPESAPPNATTQQVTGAATTALSASRSSSAQTLVVTVDALSTRSAVPETTDPASAVTASATDHATSMTPFAADSADSAEAAVSRQSSTEGAGDPVTQSPITQSPVTSATRISTVLPATTSAPVSTTTVPKKTVPTTTALTTSAVSTTATPTTPASTSTSPTTTSTTPVTTASSTTSTDTTTSSTTTSTTSTTRHTPDAPHLDWISSTRVLFHDYSYGVNWDALAYCEAGNRPTAVNPSGKYRGMFQFNLGTWKSVGGTGDPAEAGPSEQLARAKALYRDRGLQPWGCASYGKKSASWHIPGQ